MSGPFQFPVILVKLATPLLPPQTKLNFEQIGSNESFFAHNIAGGSGGGRRDEPKLPNKRKQKIVIRSRVLRYNYLGGLFHTAEVYKFICPIVRRYKTSLHQGLVLSSLAFNFKCYFILLILIYDKIRFRSPLFVQEVLARIVHFFSQSQVLLFSIVYAN